MIFSNLTSPAEALTEDNEGCCGLAKGGKTKCIFGDSAVI
jgi:hypothetical protein